MIYLYFRLARIHNSINGCTMHQFIVIVIVNVFQVKLNRLWPRNRSFQILFMLSIPIVFCSSMFP